MNKDSFTYVILSSLLVFFNPDVSAHNVNLASFKFIPPKDDVIIAGKANESLSGWVLVVDTALYNLHKSLLRLHSEDHLVNDNKYNEQAAVDYLKKNTFITVNENNSPVSLEIYDVNIGNHQSVFKFRLDTPNEKISSINIYIPAMSDNKNQMNMVKVVSEDWNSHVVLKNSNDYRSVLSPTKRH